jgi:hypothetical protein
MVLVTQAGIMIAPQNSDIIHIKQSIHVCQRVHPMGWMQDGRDRGDNLRGAQPSHVLDPGPVVLNFNPRVHLQRVGSGALPG